MASLRPACLLIAVACCLGALGCERFDRFGSELDAYGYEVDRICVESYQRGIAGEEEAEAVGATMGWNGPRIEAEIRYAWADALVSQYRMIEALGPAPEHAGLAERWARTSLKRARLYRRVGDAWLDPGLGRTEAETDLRLAKLMADHLAEPLPLEVCGRPVPGGTKKERIPTGQLLGYAPLRYTAEFPLDSLPVLRRAKDVYRRHQIVGRVVQFAPGSETVLVEIRIKPEFSRSVFDSDLRLFRGRKDPSVTWIALVPARY